MPNLAILLSQDEQYFWHFGLVIPGMKPYSNTDKYHTVDAALAAAKLVLNRRGLINA